jgi:hypothetical protein
MVRGAAVLSYGQKLLMKKISGGGDLGFDSVVELDSGDDIGQQLRSVQ